MTSYFNRFCTNLQWIAIASLVLSLKVRRRCTNRRKSTFDLGKSKKLYLLFLMCAHGVYSYFYLANQNIVCESLSVFLQSKELLGEYMRQTNRLTLPYRSISCLTIHMLSPRLPSQINSNDPYSVAISGSGQYRQHCT